MFVYYFSLDLCVGVFVYYFSLDLCVGVFVYYFSLDLCVGVFVYPFSLQIATSVLECLYTTLIGEIFAGTNFREFREFFENSRKLILAKYNFFEKTREI